MQYAGEDLQSGNEITEIREALGLKAQEFSEFLIMLYLTTTHQESSEITVPTFPSFMSEIAPVFPSMPIHAFSPFAC